MPATATDRLYGLTTSVAVKPPCRVATTAAITLSGEQTIDGVAVVSGDRVLVKDQASSIANGIYVANTSAWSRASDFDGARDAVNGTIVLVMGGNSGPSYFELTTANPVVIGTSALTFRQGFFSSLSLATFLSSGTGAVSRNAQDKIREIQISIKDFGAVGDGTTHPLSDYYATLAEAQVDYPHAVALTDEIDWAATQAGINYCVTAGIEDKARSLFAPLGDYLINRELVVTTTSPVQSVNFRMYGEYGGTAAINTANVDRPVTRFLWTGTTLDATLHVLSFNSPSASFSHSRYNALEYIVLDGGDYVSALKLDKSPNMTLYAVGLHNCRNAITAPDGSYGLRMAICELWNYSEIGIDLQDDCHNTTISTTQFYGDEDHKPTRGIRIGLNNHSSAIGIMSCDFETYGDTSSDGIDRVFIDARRVRGLTISGGCYFEEPSGSNQTHFIRLGLNSSSADCNGVLISGNYFTKATNGPLYAAVQNAIDVNRVKGAVISGNDFRGVNGQLAIVGSSNCDDIDIGPNYRDGTSTVKSRQRITNGGVVDTIDRRSTDGIFIEGQKDGVKKWGLGTSAAGFIIDNDVGAGVEVVHGAASAGTTQAAFRPRSTNTQRLGTASFLWNEIFCGNGTINLSDEREKTDTQAIPDEWLDAWGDVQFYRYRMRDAAERKGDAARWHFGVVAQRVKAAFEARGLDPFRLGLLCYDEWPDELEDVHETLPVLDADGNPKKDKEGRIITELVKTGVFLRMPAGNRYGIRYEEAYALECALQRRTTQRLEARIAALEA